MLSIHILNVGHGDSIVLEYRGDNNSSAFAVIDSNCKPGSSPPALDLLKSLDAKSLSFLAITHPHADHYMGMRAIIEYFANSINTLYTFPIKQEKLHIRKLIASYKEYALNTDSEKSHSKLLELAHVFRLASSAAENWEAPSGIKSSIAAQGFDGITISAILPPARIKGEFFQSMESIDPEKENLNDLSMAFLIEYGGHQIVLGGDGTYKNWIFQDKRWQQSGTQLSPIAVKLPHHGSKADCREATHTTIFGDSQKQQKNAIACISANGKTHPAPEVLDELVRRGILPYCTNLATRCGNERQSILESPEIDPALLRFISATIVDNEDNIRPCQGNITLEVLPDRPLKVKTQYANLCALRGDYSFLSKGIQ